MDARLRMCATLGEAILKQPHFLVALADSGGVPRYVRDLISFNGGDVSPDYDWDHKLRMLIAVAVPSCNRDEVSTLVTLTFLRTPIMRAFPVGSVTVGELERQGVLFLVPTRPAVEGTEFVVEMPLVQLEKMIGSASGDPIIPVSLLRGISSTQPLNWSDFEQLHAYVQSLRFLGLRSTCHGETCELRSVFPGAVGMALDTLCGLWSRHVCTETEMFLSRTTDIAAVVSAVESSLGRVPLRDVVAIAAPGNAVFDGRLVLADRVIVFWQDRHSLPTSDGSVSRSDIVCWYDLALACTAAWRSSGWRVLLFYMTNRRLTGAPLALGDALFRGRPDLLIVAREQLHAYLTSTFAERGILLPPDR